MDDDEQAPKQDQGRRTRSCLDDPPPDRASPIAVCSMTTVCSMATTVTTTPVNLYSSELMDVAFKTEVDLAITLSSNGAYFRRANPRRRVMGGDGPGSADASHRALRAARALTFVCTSCGSLIDFLASCRAYARRTQGRGVTGTGCASRVCSPRFRCSEFHHNQRKMSCAILSGSRILIRAPRDHIGTIIAVRRTAAVSIANAIAGEA